MPATPPATVTQSEAARLLGVSVRTVQRMVARSQLPTRVDAHGTRHVLRSALPGASGDMARHDPPDPRQGASGGGTTSPDVSPVSGAPLVACLAVALDREQRAREQLDDERAAFTTRLAAQEQAAGQREAALQAQREAAHAATAGAVAEREQLAGAARVVLDGRWRARRRARRELRALLGG